MHSKKNIVTRGKELNAQSKVLILLHGRGSTSDDILSLANYLSIEDFTLMAPQAANNTWYPYSFLMPPAQNEPGLSSALQMLRELVDDIQSKGVTTDRIYFAGFSQGACLTLEFVARNATRYGGAAAFTGGLIGDKIYRENYTGDFGQTPVFIGTSDPDPHVPVKRVQETGRILEEMNAAVTIKVYDNMGHTINQDEIDLANKLVFSNK